MFYAVFTPIFREDLKRLAKHHDKLYDRAWDIIDSVLETPFKGIGKPEPLKYLGSNIWSRRLSQEHRIVYRLNGQRIEFLQAMFHY